LIHFIPKILRRPLVSNALALYAVQGLNYLVPLLLLPYLLRVLGPDGYGTIVFAQSLMGYAIILTEFGFNFTASRDISVVRDRPDLVAKIYWSTMAAKVLLLLVSVIVLSLITLATPSFRREWPIFAASSLLVVGNVVFPQWYFQGLERLKEVAVIQAISKVVIAGSAVLFVRSAHDTCVAAVVLSAPQLAATLAAVALGKPPMPADFYRPSRIDIRCALQRGWHMFLSSMSTTLYLHTNTLVLGLIAGPRPVALYNVATRLVSAVQGLSIPVTQAVFPRASLLFAGRSEQAWDLLKRTGLLLFPLIGFGCLAMALFAPWIVRLIGGASYAGAVPILRVMAIVPLLVTCAAVMGQVVMVNLNLTKQLLSIYIAVGLINIILLLPLILALGATGAATSLVIAETLGPVLMLTVLLRYRASPEHGRNR
jgi:PST family polysaccharide transporter